MSELYADFNCPYCSQYLEIDYEEDGARYTKECHKCLKKFNVTTHIDVWADTSVHECLNDGKHEMVFINIPRDGVKMYACHCSRIEFRNE